MRTVCRACYRCFLFLVVLSSISSSTNAQTLSIGVDGGEPVEVALGAPQGSMPAGQIFIGSHQGDGFKLSWSFKYTLLSPYLIQPVKAILSAVGDGPLKIENQSSSAHSYALNLSLPLITPMDNLKAIGSVKLVVSTNSNGGSLHCPPEFPVNAPMSSLSTDLGASAGLVFCPINVGGSGAGDIGYTVNLGNPPGTGVLLSGIAMDNLSFSIAGKLTDGDTLKVSPLINFIAEAACPGDQNQDFNVSGSDLSNILGKWGTSDMLADLSVNNNVDILDISTVLGLFGQCNATGPISPPQGQSSGRGELRKISSCYAKSLKPMERELRRAAKRSHKLDRTQRSRSAKAVKELKRCISERKSASRNGTSTNSRGQVGR